MIFKILLKYILGYVNISAEGLFIERFINTCISKKIFMWNIKREKTTYMRANVGISDFKKLKSIAKKTRCKIEIKEKRGLPFLLNRYRKRKIFFATLVVIIGVMIALSNFIWNIEVIGIEQINPDEIINALEANGLKVRRFQIKYKYARNNK